MANRRPSRAQSQEIYTPSPDDDVPSYTYDKPWVPRIRGHIEPDALFWMCILQGFMVEENRWQVDDRFEDRTAAFFDLRQFLCRFFRDPDYGMHLLQRAVTCDLASRALPFERVSCHHQSHIYETRARILADRTRRGLGPHTFDPLAPHPEPGHPDEPDRQPPGGAVPEAVPGGEP